MEDRVEATQFPHDPVQLFGFAEVYMYVYNRMLDLPQHTFDHYLFVVTTEVFYCGTIIDPPAESGTLWKTEIYFSMPASRKIKVKDTTQEARQLTG